MSKENTKVIRIIDEIIHYLQSMGATKIDLDYQELADSYILTFKCNYNKEKMKRIYQMVKCLHLERQEEMEDTFWALAGEHVRNPELALVGMMTDDAKVYFDDERIEITLERVKHTR
ncbi:MAG TPA: hypothetical protein DDX29_10895 [Clostridiales bacterium]|nr:hypothetical protein [Clostridiales bacterium]